MRSVRLVLLGVALGGMAGCARSDDGPEGLARRMLELEHRVDTLTLDTSTPDRALQSYWRVLDFPSEKPEMKAVTAAYRRMQLPQRAAAWRRVTDGVVLADKADTASYPDQVYEREIVEVKAESETRSVIIARMRNVTPVPTGSVVSETEARMRTEGETFRYILEKGSNGWRVTQAQRKDYIGDGWRNYFEPPHAGGRVSTYVAP